jgi:hypothetical protein
MKLNQYNSSQLNWISLFISLFDKDIKSVIETVNGGLKQGAEKEYSPERKKLFLEAAQIVFKGETKIASNKIQELKKIFKENEILLGLQKEFNIEVSELFYNNNITSSQEELRVDVDMGGNNDDFSNSEEN